MSAIYVYEAYVTVWLGEEANENSQVFDLLRLVAKHKLNMLNIYEQVELAKCLGTKHILHIPAFVKRSLFNRIWV
jgi:hypothetical protein